MTTTGNEYVLAPTISGPRDVTNTATTDATSTAAVDVLSTKAPGYYTVAAVGVPITVVFGGVSTMGAATIANGEPIAAGTSKRFYLTSDTRYMRVIATGTATGQSVSTYRSGP